jgi:hypothetical protein
VRKSKQFRPQTLPFPSLVIVTGTVLLFAAAFLPQANADFCPPGEDCQLLVHWNFNSEINNQQPPYPSEETTGPPPTAPFLFNDPVNAFDPGNLVVDSDAGTLDNALPGELAGGALDARGNTSLSGHEFCFDLGPIDASGFDVISLSFALQSLGNGGQFTTLTLNWSTNGTTWTQFDQFTDLQTHSTYFVYDSQFNTGGADTIYIQFCFDGSKNNAVQNHTFIDNIEVDAIIPEPATVTGGLLGVLGLCWHQRRRLIRCVRLRRT